MLSGLLLLLPPLPQQVVIVAETSFDGFNSMIVDIPLSAVVMSTYRVLFIMVRWVTCSHSRSFAALDPRSGGGLSMRDAPFETAKVQLSQLR